MMNAYTDWYQIVEIELANIVEKHEKTIESSSQMVIDCCYYWSKS